MMGILRLLALLAPGALWCSMPAHSQCLPLTTLTEGLAEGHLTPQTMKASLPASEWEFHQPTTGAVYWLCTISPEQSAAPVAETRVELRRSNQQAQYDVVYKTARKACINECRAELRRAKLKPEPVTCVQCEAERYSAPTYTVTIYSQQESFTRGKVPSPYVLVVHQLAGPPAAN